jgi:hypothetical protein
VKQRLLAVALIVAGVLCAALPERAGELLLQGAASRAATEQVDAALERNQDTFLILSAAEAAVAVVEGSGVGVGFDLQIGDVVQPVLDLVHFFWRLLLFSLLLLGAYKLLMETGILSLGIAGLGFALGMWGAGLLWPAWRRRLHAGARGVALPAALLATQWLSASYTRGLEQRYRGAITAFGADLRQAKDALLDPETTPPWYQPGQRIEDFQARVSAAARYVGERFDASLLSFTFYGILLLFDYLVLPFASAWLLYRLAALAFARLLPPARAN